jgi:hypothetical protein
MSLNLSVYVSISIRPMIKIGLNDVPRRTE